MSVINQMLQDLEKRQPEGEAPPPASTRAVPRQRRMPFFWPLLLLLAVAAGALAWQLWQTFAPRQPAPPPAIAAAPSARPAPAVPASPPPEAVAAPEPPQPVAQAPAIPPADAGSRAVIEPVLKQSTEPTFPAKPLVPAPTPKPAPAPAAARSASQPAGTSPPAVAKQVRELTPSQRAESEYRKALSLIPQGRVAEAIDGLALALQLDASHAAARQTLIGLLVEARRFAEAERRLLEGLALDRAQPELAMTLARLQVERGDTGSAIATLERTEPHAADRADYPAFMAALLQREERHREAIDHYRQALRRAPHSAVWQMGLGISLQAENRLQEAREAFGRAHAAGTLSPELQAFVEQRLRQMGQ